MPKFDGTGPQGQGPMTGRGMGPCGPGYARGFARGMGKGFGRGRLFGICPACPYVGYASEPQTQKEILEALDDEEQMLKQELEAIKQEKESLRATK